MSDFLAWHSYRLGNAHPIVVVPRVETIDATQGRTDFLGHGYFLGNVNISPDITEVIEGRPVPRAHLLLQREGSGKYWRYVP